jgi:hypothetical protein
LSRKWDGTGQIVGGMGSNLEGGSGGLVRTYLPEIGPVRMFRCVLRFRTWQFLTRQMNTEFFERSRSASIWPIHRRYTVGVETTPRITERLIRWTICPHRHSTSVLPSPYKRFSAVHFPHTSKVSISTNHSIILPKLSLLLSLAILMAGQAVIGRKNQDWITWAGLGM